MLNMYQTVTLSLLMIVLTQVNASKELCKVVGSSTALYCDNSRNLTCCMSNFACCYTWDIENNVPEHTIISQSRDFSLSYGSFCTEDVTTGYFCATLREYCCNNDQCCPETFVIDVPEGLSTAAIAGIVVGSIVGAGVLMTVAPIICIVCCSSPKKVAPPKTTNVLPFKTAQNPSNNANPEIGVERY